jgi:hypothetical protein
VRFFQHAICQGVEALQNSLKLVMYISDLFHGFLNVDRLQRTGRRGDDFKHGWTLRPETSLESGGLAASCWAPVKTRGALVEPRRALRALGRLKG